MPSVPLIANPAGIKSFTLPGKLYSQLNSSTVGIHSQSIATMSGTGSVSLTPSLFTMSINTSAAPYMQYPIGSVLRTSYEIAKKLQQYVPGITVISRMPTDVYTGPMPVIIVSPSMQHVHQVFTGYAGNPDGVPNRYKIRYLGQKVAALTTGMAVQQAQEKLWFYLELILRALKKDGLGTLNGTVVRVADVMDLTYSEAGSYLVWREDSYISSVMDISVFEQYRVYGL